MTEKWVGVANFLIIIKGIAHNFVFILNLILEETQKAGFIWITSMFKI